MKRPESESKFPNPETTPSPSLILFEIYRLDMIDFRKATKTLVLKVRKVRISPLLDLIIFLRSGAGVGVGSRDSNFKISGVGVGSRDIDLTPESESESLKNRTTPQPWFYVQQATPPADIYHINFRTSM